METATIVIADTAELVERIARGRTDTIRVELEHFRSGRPYLTVTSPRHIIRVQPDDTEVVVTVQHNDRARLEVAGAAFSGMPVAVIVATIEAYL